MNDRHRPTYHFSPDNWMNDPKPFFWAGEYHIYFQHNPFAPVWAAMHWGHTVSRDLTHWQTLPVALAPSQPAADMQGGCWTGCVVRGDDNQFHILYTGVPQMKPLVQKQCLASSDNLITWEKYENNPILAPKPDGYGECFRDPLVWKHDDGHWYMIIGGELPEGKGGAAFLYRATDNGFTEWEYLHTLLEGNAAETQFDFECPDFFPLRTGSEERWVFIASRGKTWWHTGHLTDALRFERDRWGEVDGGTGWSPESSGSFYAAKTLVDDRGRRILFGWLMEKRPVDEQIAAGWSGVLSLPRILSLGADHTLRSLPVPELESLRGTSHRFENLTVNGTLRLDIPGIAGDSVEIQVSFSPTDSPRYGIAVRCSSNQEEMLTILYDATRKCLTGGNCDTALSRADGETLTLRIFVDKSVIEVFDAEGRAALTLRTYPKAEDATGIMPIAEESPVLVSNLTVWEMRP